MIRSMTGFGGATFDSTECSLAVEVRSVNNKFLKVKTRLPALLASLERRLDGIIRKNVSRGTVDLSVRLDMKSSGAAWTLNEKLLEKSIRIAGRLARRKDVADAMPSAAELLSLPGVMEQCEDRKLSPKIERALAQAVEKAVKKMSEAREAEGQRLAAAIRRERTALERLIDRIGRRAPAAMKEQTGRLKKRVETLLEGERLGADDAALRREIAFMADRGDITEEMDRLASHLEQFDRILGHKGPVGRALDFLIQEIGRELNTIGSKASDARISQSVAEAKGTLEKIREQVQNLE